jgi:hypothetical protein
MNGYVKGGPKVLLQLEGLGVLALSVTAYAISGFGWAWFALFFLAPDLTMLGYLGGRAFGAAAYNLGHSYLGPMLLLGAGVALHIPLALNVGLIWAAHIGFDRMLGYGLKYSEGFGFTHLGAKGKARAPA